MTHYAGIQYLLQRKCKRTGFNETVVYEGNLRNKPKGWTVVKRIG
ncbi:hypothetical protein [Bacillus sp. M6-12]|nr:hypothetical protein [Bacillus sp. M6-12]